METIKLARQSLLFQKTVFENSFNAMALTQDQTEKMVSAYLEQLPWVTDEGKKSLKDTIDMAKKARDDFKKAVDEGYAKFEELLEEK